MLQLKDVKKSFKQPDGSELPILDIEEFKVAAGEQVVVVGPSGCGKTTLLHIIAGIGRPTSGKVKIDGWDITLMDEAERDQFRAQHIGYVFQTFNLLPGFTALENVLLGMTFAKGGSPLRAAMDFFLRPVLGFSRHNPDWDRARHLLERVGLGHRLHHKPPMLSVGEQQRVALARALANRPRLLLADEPTANVDTGNQQAIVDLLQETCREEKVALVLVTHAPEVARQFPRIVPLEEINRVLALR